MEEYLRNLINQYKRATGINNVDVNSEEFINEFSEWIKIRKKMGDKYSSFIEYMGVNLIDNSSAEVGKGELDSIVLDTNASMITPYSDKIKKSSDELIDAEFRVYSSVPMIVKGSKIKLLNAENIKRFITQNPYEKSCIINWEQLHNHGENITVGMYGNIYDKDISKKIGQLELLKSNLIGDAFKEEYATEGDIYYYVISSDRINKSLTKTITKKYN